MFANNDLLNKNTFSPATINLSGENVHICRASLTRPQEMHRKLLQLLSDDERERAKRFYFERDQQRYIIGRGLLRQLLGAYLQIDPAKIKFSYNSYGKPRLDASHNTSLHFNLAHSADQAIYLFTPGQRAGIDLEYIRPMPDEDLFASLYFSQRESSLLSQRAGSDKTIDFFKLWTSKEAYLKAVGAGLAGDLRQVEVELLPGQAARFLSLSRNPALASAWQLKLFTPCENFQAALAIETDFVNIQARHFELD